MTIRGWHGETRGEVVGAFRSDVYVALDLDLAESYAEGRPVLEVEYDARNPYVVADGADLDRLLTDSAALDAENWHPAGTGRVARLLRERGYDALVIRQETFDAADQAGWEVLAGTYGEPQAVLLDPERARVVARSTPSSG